MPERCRDDERRSALRIQNFCGMAIAGRLYILGSYWGFALISLHLGLHREFFTRSIKKEVGALSVKIHTNRYHRLDSNVWSCGFYQTTFSHIYVFALGICFP